MSKLIQIQCFLLEKSFKRKRFVQKGGCVSPNLLTRHQLSSLKLPFGVPHFQTPKWCVPTMAFTTRARRGRGVLCSFGSAEDAAGDGAGFNGVSIQWVYPQSSAILDGIFYEINQPAIKGIPQKFMETSRLRHFDPAQGGRSLFFVTRNGIRKIPNCKASSKQERNV